MAPVKIYRSTVAGHIPPALESGQIAINEADGIFFWKDATSGAIASFNFARPTAPTQATADSSTKVATTAFVHTALDLVTNGAPAALDTLKELADALGSDANFSATVMTALGNRLRVDAPQSLSAGQQSQGRANLSLGDASLQTVADAAAFISNAGSRLISPNAAWAAAGYVNLGAVSGAVTLNMSQAINFAMTAVGAITFVAPIGRKPGQAGSIYVVQDGGGGKSISFAQGPFYPVGRTWPNIATEPNAGTYYAYQDASNWTGVIAVSGGKI